MLVPRTATEFYNTITDFLDDAGERLNRDDYRKLVKDLCKELAERMNEAYDD